jgi:peptidoglycan/LPS O-acetylase OafA/YrhL
VFLTTPISNSGNRRETLPALTSLRFFAALLVILFHCDLAIHPWPIDGLLRAGIPGVTFFFVLSGFILTYVHADKPVTAPGFWAVRAARILPVYYLGALLAAPQFFYPALVVHTVSLRQLLPGTILTPVLLQSWMAGAETWNPAAWSLSVEAFFYALFPFQLWLMSRRGVRQEFIVASLALIATSLARHFIVSLPMYFPPLYWPSFALGMALGRLFIKSQFKGSPFLFYTVGMAALVILAVTDESSVVRTDLVLVPLFGLLIFLAAHQVHSPRWLISPTLILLGEASYALYILHMPLMFWWHVARFPVLSQPLWATAFVIIAVLISIAAYLFVERPAKRWFLRRWFAIAGLMGVQAT